MSFFSKLFGVDDAGRVPVLEPACNIARPVHRISESHKVTFMGKAGDPQYVEFHARIPITEYFDIVNQANQGHHHAALFLLRGSKGHGVAMSLPKLRIISHGYERANLINQSHATFTAAVLAPAEYTAVMPTPKAECAPSRAETPTQPTESIEVS